MDDNLESIAQCGNRLKEMIQNNAGWKDVKQIMDQMRKEAFIEWTNLPLDSPTEKVISIRARDGVVATILAKIEEAVKAGEEAQEQLATARGDIAAEHDFAVANGAVADEELANLSKPLSPISDNLARGLS